MNLSQQSTEIANCPQGFCPFFHPNPVLSYVVTLCLHYPNSIESKVSQIVDNIIVLTHLIVYERI